ncbi:MAG: helix-turn-helix transcriptional regulator [Dehalococcoidia bacterium]|nr:helix-turn-helix transcriptional regulator [Dehalococcoidia bacterium]MYA52119.1 helix-turn-helix transcriptional regulator [Dehalococcoidia bacterium]
MADGSLDLSELGRLFAAERSRRGMSLREASDDVGIPFNTLARVEKGHVPDLPKFKRLVEWCGADIGQFFEPHEKATVTTDVIAEHLHSDRSLSPEAADRIAAIVNELYEALARPERVSAVHLRAATTFRPDAAHALGELVDDLHQALLRESRDGPS